MKITATHTTVYRYDYPVYLDPHIFRLRPRMTTTQQLLAFDIQIAPLPAGTTECLDQDGNLALNAWFDTPTSSLGVTSRFTVEMLRQNPFDYILTRESLNLPLWYTDLLCAALIPYRHEANIAESVKQFAKSLAADARWNTLSFLLALSEKIFQTCRQVVRQQGGPWPSDQTLRLREGSCRDLAVLFCDACRVMGIAARFVSGYECASAQSQDPLHARMGRSLFAGDRLAGIRSCSRAGSVQRTCRASRGFRLRSRSAGGGVVFRPIGIADGSIAVHAG